MKLLRQVLALSAFIGIMGGGASLFAAETTQPAEGQTQPVEGQEAPKEATKQETAKAPPKDLVLRGDAVCTSCHDESESYPVLAIGKTKHGVIADARTPKCTSCHGESEKHLTVPVGVKERPKPDRLFGMRPTIPADLQVERYFGIFGKKTGTPVADRNEPCLGCHKGDKRIHWMGSAHEAGDVACTSCHQIHTAHDRARDKAAQAEICFACHKEQRAMVNRPSHHPVLEGKVGCSDCHNPHGSAGPKLLVRDSVNATCYTCHMEKRGPFLWEHQPVTDDCSNCHNPHGSAVDSLLKVRQPFLCQQCHEPTSHRGNVPGVINATPYDNAPQSRGITQGRACLNCHTNIHGGSSPTNNSAARSFRR